MLQQGKTGGGNTDWTVLLIVLGIGATVIVLGGLVYWLWRKHKRRAVQVVEEKAAVVGQSGAGAPPPAPPQHNTLILEDE